MKKKNLISHFGTVVGSLAPVQPQSIYGLFDRFHFLDDDGKKGRVSCTLVSASLDKFKLEKFAKILNRAESVKQKIFPANTIVEYWYVESVRTF